MNKNEIITILNQLKANAVKDMKEISPINEMQMIEFIKGYFSAIDDAIRFFSQDD